jgi:NADPH:quinone reductase-like Zn-dependent oxidoreductase
MVVARDDDVTNIEVGDHVLVHEAPLGGSGFWAEQVLVVATHLAKRPAALNIAFAGGLAVAGLTALQALDALELGVAGRVLITGGSGTTGAIAVQLAAQAGAEVIATAAPRHAVRLRRLGASNIVDSHKSDWAQSSTGGSMRYW